MDEDQQEALARIRFLAAISHNSAPPHCHPLTILLLILSVGIIFIGMTMTIVAHWPGSVSVGFDPLSVPGPIILSLGGALLICSIFLVCYFNMKEKERRNKKLLNFAMSKPNLNMSSFSKHHQRSLEFEPKSRQRRTSETGEDQPDVNAHLLQKDRGKVDTTDTTTETTSPQNDDIPEPLRQKSKSGKKSGKKKDNLSQMQETESFYDSDQFQNENEIRQITKTTVTTTTTTKKKKINTNYSRDNVLANFESKRSSEADDPAQQSAEEHSLKIHVKAPVGANINIRNL